MQRRKFIAGVGSLAAAGAAGIGTGAFSSMSASRGADINVVNDSNGLIALKPGDSADERIALQDGELKIDFTSSEGGQGVNTNSLYRVGGLSDKHVAKTPAFPDPLDSELDSFLDGTPNPYDDPAFKIVNNDSVEHVVNIGYDLTGSLNSDGSRMNLQARSENLRSGTDITVRMGIDNANTSDVMGYEDGVGRTTGDWPLQPGGYIGVSLLVDTRRSGAGDGENLSGTLSVNTS